MSFLTKYMECSKFCFKKQIHTNLITYAHVLSLFCSSSQVTEYSFKIETLISLNPTERLIFNDVIIFIFKV